MQQVRNETYAEIADIRPIYDDEPMAEYPKTLSSFLSSILLLVVIIVMVVFVVVVLVVIAIVGVVIVVVFGIIVVVVPLVPVFLLGLLVLAIDAACAFRAEEMPSLLSCRMAAKVSPFGRHSINRR
ncbi:hypothetical protein Tco_0567858 [Tanacetum coccineum]